MPHPATSATGATVPVAPDMLAVFDTIEVRNEEKISATDRDFCERHQRVLARSLDQLQKWYDLLRKEADAYADRYQATFRANGTVEYRSPYSWTQPALDYSEFEFRPFDTLNQVVELYHRALTRFARNIVSHFNDHYHLSVEMPDIDRENTPMGTRPTYTTYVDTVIAHLGGRGFQEVAQAELIDRLHKTVFSSWAKDPMLVGNKIVFDQIHTFSDITLEFHQRYDFEYGALGNISHICAGLILYANGSLNGDYRIIEELDEDDVDLKRWYSLSAGAAQAIKFYKNGRIDVRFTDRASAEACYNLLCLDKPIVR